MKHTPGEYTVEKTLSGVPGFEIVTVLDPERDHRYCRGIAKVYEGDLIKNGRANADLLAAAPDMLDACKAILVFLTGDEYHEYYYQAQVRQLRAAIAKAKGEQ